MKFKIKQTRHYTNKGLYKLLHFLQRNNYQKYSVVFSDNAWYPSNNVGKSGWNKIFGFGCIFHHSNSARLVWQPDFDNKGMLKIAAYVYDNGEWTDYEFSKVPINTARSMAIWATADSYKFKCGNDQYEVEHPNPVYIKKLWPYFGGWDRAYRDIYITLYPIKDVEWDD